MRLLAPTIALFALTTCAQLSDRPVQLGMSVSVPDIDLARLDDQLHLRVFAQGSFTCMESQGQVFSGGMLAMHGYGGDRVNPSIRCGSNWQTQMSMYDGVSMPVDLCFSKTAAAPMVQVPAGTYIVLVEGSGVQTTGGANILLGAGCTTVMTMPGSTVMLTINMVEQANIGACGNGMTEQNEACDNGAAGPSDTCDNQCEFPERSATIPAPGGTEITMGPETQPTIGWAAGQEMIVGFSSNEPHVYTHVFQQDGTVDMEPVVLESDLAIASDGRSEQQGLRLAGYATGVAAVWQSTARTFTDFDVAGTFVQYSSYPPAPMQAFANPTSMTAGANRTSPAVAVNGSTVVFVYQDSTTNNLRIATTTLTGGTLTAPAADAPLVATGPSTNMPAAPAIVATPSGFVVAWTAGTPGSQDVYALTLDATGHVMGTPIVANSVTTGNQSAVAIAANDTDVVMAWHDDSGADPTDTDGTVRFRAFSPTLTPTNPEVVAPTTTPGDQITPAIAVSPSHVALIVWENATDNTIRGIEINATSGAGVINSVTGTTSDFLVEATATEIPTGSANGPRHAPAAAYGGASLFGVVWQDDGLNSVRMRTFPGS